MVNEDHDPSDAEEKILDVLTDGRERGEPWGYVTPKYLHQLDEDEDAPDIPDVNFNLGRLRDAGWITRVCRGFYRFSKDPREDRDSTEAGTK